MKNWFGEKAGQVEPESLNAFGIDISSRYGKAYEIIQMLEFAKRTAERNLEHYVKNIFYDSKGSICSLELASSVKNEDPVSSALFEIAKDTIDQFIWFGEIKTGGELDHML